MRMGTTDATTRHGRRTQTDGGRRTTGTAGQHPPLPLWAPARTEWEELGMGTEEAEMAPAHPRHSRITQHPSPLLRATARRMDEGCEDGADNNNMMRMTMRTRTTMGTRLTRTRTTRTGMGMMTRPTMGPGTTTMAEMRWDNRLTGVQ